MNSLHYCGTLALKTDFTRTGRRTLRGSATDLWVSLRRYVLNNFHDGFRQDAIDLFLGNHVPTPDGVVGTEGALLRCVCNSSAAYNHA